MLIDLIMEVSVYLSFDHKNKNSKVFCRRVQCPEVFEYDAFVRVMRSIFGKDIVIEFLVA